MNDKKTYKREVSIGLFAIYFALLIWGILGNPEAAAAAERLTYPVFTFGAGAFAIDAVFRQGR